jgi:hypothetical protein
MRTKSPWAGLWKDGARSLARTAPGLRLGPPIEGRPPGTGSQFRKDAYTAGVRYPRGSPLRLGGR